MQRPYATLNQTDRKVRDYMPPYEAAQAGLDWAVIAGTSRADAAVQAYSDVEAMLTNGGFQMQGKVMLAEARQRRQRSRVHEFAMGAAAAGSVAILAITTGLIPASWYPSKAPKPVFKEGEQELLVGSTVNGRPYHGEFTLELFGGETITFGPPTANNPGEAYLPYGTYPVWTNKGGPGQPGEGTSEQQTTITVTPQTGEVIVGVPPQRGIPNAW